uniref:Uncharacterized protein n=1 Tax=Crocodylus porosus TaxID=8502 RepID=A0A7M4FEM9_CROPO
MAKILLCLKTNKCWRGYSNLGGFYHIWWTCPRIKMFWKKAGELMRKVTLTMQCRAAPTLGHKLPPALHGLEAL